jgi:hypothetical protein
MATADTIADVLILGPITFTNFSPPERMPFGGRQIIAKHILLGGERVIDTMGPDDHDIHWEGQFFGSDAYRNCLALDALRAAGSLLPLSFAGQGYSVVIGEFHADIRRLPLWIDYHISCVIATNGAHGILGAISAGVDALVAADLTGAISIAI